MSPGPPSPFLKTGEEPGRRDIYICLRNPEKQCLVMLYVVPLFAKPLFVSEIHDATEWLSVEVRGGTLELAL